MVGRGPPLSPLSQGTTCSCAAARCGAGSWTSARPRETSYLPARCRSGGGQLCRCESSLVHCPQAARRPGEVPHGSVLAASASPTLRNPMCLQWSLPATVRPPPGHPRLPNGRGLWQLAMVLHNNQLLESACARRGAGQVPPCRRVHELGREGGGSVDAHPPC